MGDTDEKKQNPWRERAWWALLCVVAFAINLGVEQTLVAVWSRPQCIESCQAVGLELHRIAYGSKVRHAACVCTSGRELPSSAIVISQLAGAVAMLSCLGIGLWLSLRESKKAG